MSSGTLFTPAPGAGGASYDQDLNTTDSVTFANVQTTGNFEVNTGGVLDIYNVGAPGDINFEKLQIDFGQTTANVATIGTKFGGEGVTRGLFLDAAALELRTAGQQRLRVSSSEIIWYGSCRASSDFYNLGITDKRWGTVYAVAGDYEGDVSIGTGGVLDLYNLGAPGDVNYERLRIDFGITTPGTATLSAQAGGTGGLKNVGFYGAKNFYFNDDVQISGVPGGTSEIKKITNGALKFQNLNGTIILESASTQTFTGTQNIYNGLLRCNDGLRFINGADNREFIRFEATVSSDNSTAISSNTISGATTHHVQVDINGTKAWIAVSTNPPT